MGKAWSHWVVCSYDRLSVMSERGQIFSLLLLFPAEWWWAWRGVELIYPWPLDIHPAWIKEPEDSMLPSWARPVHNKIRKQTAERKSITTSEGKKSWEREEASNKALPVESQPPRTLPWSHRWHDFRMSFWRERPPPDSMALSSLVEDSSLTWDSKYFYKACYCWHICCFQSWYALRKAASFPAADTRQNFQHPFYRDCKD